MMLLKEESILFSALWKFICIQNSATLQWQMRLLGSRKAVDLVWPGQKRIGASLVSNQILTYMYKLTNISSYFKIFSSYSRSQHPREPAHKDCKPVFFVHPYI